MVDGRWAEQQYVVHITYSKGWKHMTLLSQVSSGYAPVENGELYYEVAGSGHPLLLIHAGVADRRMWDDQFAAFAERFRVIRYDTRGYGMSRTEPTSFSNLQDVADLLRHLGVERAHVIGVSRGGQIAVDFTLEHPKMVSALIPTAAGLSGYDHQPAEAEADLSRTLEQMETAWEAKDWERLVDLEVRYWVDGPGQPEGRAPAAVREKVQAMCLNNYRSQTVEPTPRPLAPPAIGRLGEIAAPTLVLIGDLDEPACLRIADILMQGILGARIIVFPGVAHMIPMEVPEAFNRVVLEFLDTMR
jgi:pimeloyl-ACP methyl ester carboxylesterase